MLSEWIDFLFYGWKKTRGWLCNFLVVVIFSQSAIPQPFFYVNCAQSRYRYKAPYKANPLPEHPDATSSSVTSRSATAVIVNCRPPDYELHRSGRPSHRGWCGTVVRACSKTRRPVRRPNLRYALLRPISQSGPRTGTCHPIFGPCALAPPIFVAAPLPMMPSSPREPACPSSAPTGGSYHSLPAEPPSDNHPRSHLLTSES